MDIRVFTAWIHGSTLTDGELVEMREIIKAELTRRASLRQQHQHEQDNHMNRKHVLLALVSAAATLLSACAITPAQKQQIVKDVVAINTAAVISALEQYDATGKVNAKVVERAAIDASAHATLLILSGTITQP